MNAARKKSLGNLDPKMIGNAKIFHIDAIEMLQSLQSESVDLLATDPAYSGMNQHLSLGRGRIVGEYSNLGKEGDKWFQEFHDTPDNYREFLSQAHRVLRNNSHIYLMFDSYSLISLAPIVREIFEVKNIVTWDKINIGMGHYFRRQTEFILFASKGKAPLSARNFPDIWKIKRIHRAGYPTQKPTEVFEMMIAASNVKGSAEYTVLDPFMGSASSGIACARQNVYYIGADIAPHAIDIAGSRLTSFLETGIDQLQLKTHIDSNQLHLLGR